MTTLPTSSLVPVHLQALPEAIEVSSAGFVDYLPSSSVPACTRTASRRAVRFPAPAFLRPGYVAPEVTTLERIRVLAEAPCRRPRRKRV